MQEGPTNVFHLLTIPITFPALGAFNGEEGFPCASHVLALLVRDSNSIQTINIENITDTPIFLLHRD